MIHLLNIDNYFISSSQVEKPLDEEPLDYLQKLIF